MIVDQYDRPFEDYYSLNPEIQELLRVAGKHYREHSKREVETFNRLDPFSPALYDCNDQPIEKTLEYTPMSGYFQYPIEEKEASCGEIPHTDLHHRRRG